MPPDSIIDSLLLRIGYYLVFTRRYELDDRLPGRSWLIRFLPCLLPLTVLMPIVATGQERTVAVPLAGAALTRSLEASLRSRHPGAEVANIALSSEGEGFSFFLSGDLGNVAIPKKRTALESSASGAAAFLKSESGFLQLQEPHDQLRTRDSITGKDGKTHVRFSRYIAGIRVDRADFRVHINPSGSVFAFNGYAVPISQEVRERIAGAATAVHVSQAAINRALILDLGERTGFQARLEKLAIVVEPWVVWDADVSLETAPGRWVYRFDARTGEILSKEERSQTLHPGGGAR